MKDGERDPCWRHIGPLTYNQVLQSQADRPWGSSPCLGCLLSWGGHLVFSGLVAPSPLPSPYSGLDPQQLGSVLPGSPTEEDSMIGWSLDTSISVFCGISFYHASDPSCQGCRASQPTLWSRGTTVSLSPTNTSLTKSQVDPMFRVSRLWEILGRIWLRVNSEVYIQLLLSESPANTCSRGNSTHQ